MFFSANAISLTKYASGTTCLVIEQMLIILVWCFFLIWGGYGSEDFEALKLLGFVMIVMGILMFNDVFSLDVLFDERPSNLQQDTYIEINIMQEEINERDE